MPTVHDPSAFVQHWNTELFDRQNLDAIDDLVADEFVGHDPALPEPMRGPEDVRQSMEILLEAFPDLAVQQADLLVEDDRVAVRNTIAGTHEGEYMGVEPTGEEIEVTVMAIQRIADGQYVEEFRLVDSLSMLQQLGVVEPPMG